MNTRTRTRKARNPKAETRNSATGFTLVELLIAMFILAIGLSAIVSVFYAAASLQQRAVDAVTSVQARSNAKSMLTGRGISEAALIAQLNRFPPNGINEDEWDEDGLIHRLGDPADDDMLEIQPSGGPPFPAIQDSWPLILRALPLPDPNHPDGYPTAGPVANADPQAVNRDFYWVPLVQDQNLNPGEHDWMVYAFVIRKSRDDHTPGSGFPSGAISANPDDQGTYPDDPTTGAREGEAQVIPQVYGIDAEPVPGEPRQLQNVAHGGYIRIGDQVLVSSGVAANVVDMRDGGSTLVFSVPHDLPSASPYKELWFAPPAESDGPSPTYAIFPLTGNQAVQQ